jgi:hypothetical protein
MPAISFPSAFVSNQKQFAQSIALHNNVGYIRRAN